ncbi:MULTISPECIES: GNAT family N-acetyltransferase [unclassified Pseudomonas]|uniref:GNAT family N-acetyltransferase n=1 Tax=unclassified Pseudomonas TaxID=196821 RepID=UPI0035319EA9
MDVTVYTDPAAQRRGIGRALYQRLEQVRVLCRVRRYRLLNAADIGIHEPPASSHWHLSQRGIQAWAMA